MSGLNGQKVSHDTSERLSYLLASEISEKRPGYALAQANMKETCIQCHTRDIIERTYEFYRKAGFRRELMISEPGMRGILNFLSETTVPEAKKAEPMQFFDDRFVRQLNSDK